MDKLLYVAMSGAKETLRAQAVNNHNLANANTTGFKANMAAFESRAVNGPGFASRVYATDDQLGWDNSVGAMITTGNPLDIAVQGQGFIAVQAPNGNEAYTRAGDLHIDPSGMLITATGHPVMGDGGPISLPPSSSVTIGGDGSISVVSKGSPMSQTATIARIKLVNPPPGAVQEGLDSLFHAAGDQPLQADANTRIASGVLESSNVNMATAMVNMIELARKFDMQIKALHDADENGQASSKLLSAS